MWCESMHIYVMGVYGHTMILYYMHYELLLHINIIIYISLLCMLCMGLYITKRAVNKWVYHKIFYAFIDTPHSMRVYIDIMIFYYVRIHGYTMSFHGIYHDLLVYICIMIYFKSKVYLFTIHLSCYRGLPLIIQLSCYRIISY